MNHPPARCRVLSGDSDNLAAQRPLTQSESRREFRRSFNKKGEVLTIQLLSLILEGVKAKTKTRYFRRKIAKNWNELSASLPLTPPSPSLLPLSSSPSRIQTFCEIVNSRFLKPLDLRHFNKWFFWFCRADLDQTDVAGISRRRISLTALPVFSMR